MLCWFMLQLWPEPRVIPQARFYLIESKDMVKEKAIEMFNIDMSILKFLEVITLIRWWRQHELG